MSKIRFAVPLLIVLAGALAGCERNDTPPDSEQPPAAAPAPAHERAAPFAVADAGLEVPESVLYDEQADVYLVSNINGSPDGRDDNGFIARIRPDGSVETLRWIDGASQNVTLHSPKGMGLAGDTLFVADLDSVRAFHRTTGAALGARGVAGGAAFLNDVAIGPDGSVYVTDTGIDASFKSIGKEAIYRFGPGGATAVAAGTALKAPNGIVIDGDAVLMAGIGANTVTRHPIAGGQATVVATLPQAELDGLVRLSDGTLLVTSWAAKTVYRVSPTGQVTAAVENVESPADIGWDSRRNRVIIPIFTGNRLEVREIR